MYRCIHMYTERPLFGGSGPVGFLGQKLNSRFSPDHKWFPYGDKNWTAERSGRLSGFAVPAARPSCSSVFIPIRRLLLIRRKTAVQFAVQQTFTVVDENWTTERTFVKRIFFKENSFNKRRSVVQFSCSTVKNFWTTNWTAAFRRFGPHRLSGAKTEPK